MINENLPLPLPVLDYENFMISDFFNNLLYLSHSHALPKNAKSINKIQVSVEVPFANTLENVILYIFRSRPSGYSLILQTNLNLTTMPNYRTYYDFTNSMNNISLSDNDRLAIVIIPNAFALGKLNRALTIKIDLTNIEDFSETSSLTTPVDPAVWPII